MIMHDVGIEGQARSEVFLPIREETWKRILWHCRQTSAHWARMKLL